MKQIYIADTTLCREDRNFIFKEKIEIARLLERLGVDRIELPAIQNVRTDTLLVRTISSFVRDSIISVAAGLDMAGVENAAAAISAAEKAQIRIELPLSVVGMEYTCHKKPAKMTAWISEVVAAAKAKCGDVEFCAIDATRAEQAFLREAIDAAVAAGATSVTVCDSAARLLPDDFAAFIQGVAKDVPVPVGVRCDNRTGMASAQAVLAVKAGVSIVKTAVSGDTVELAGFAGLIRDCGADYGMTTGIRATELHRVVNQIEWILEHARKESITGAAGASSIQDEMKLDVNDDMAAVNAAVARLGYDLSDEDQLRVYDEVKRVAARKDVGERELEAIVASTALQVPPTYVLKSYVINSGNIITPSAQVTLQKGDKTLQGISLGDGPIDASILAIEQIMGRHFDMDDFQVRSVTQGTGAVGSAFVKLRVNGKVYSGNGISTDIIGASIRAFLGAVNKVAYEEAQA